MIKAYPIDTFQGWVSCLLFSLQYLVSSKEPLYYNLNCASLLLILGSYQVPAKDQYSWECCLLTHNLFKKSRIFWVVNLWITLFERPQEFMWYSWFSEVCHSKHWLCMPPVENLCVCVPRGHHPRADGFFAFKTDALSSRAKWKQNTLEHHPLPHFNYPLSFILKVQMLSLVVPLFHVLDIWT